MSQTLLLIEQYRYIVLFPLAMFEGPVVSLMIGFLIHQGFLSLVPSFAILMLGDLIPDSVYYAIGRYGNHKNVVQKYSSKSKIISSNFAIAEKLWLHNPKKTMFLSKLAYGLSTIFLISAGMVKMPFRKFVSYALPVTVFQYSIILALGYFLGKSYYSALPYISYGGYIIAGILVAFIIGYIATLRYARKKIEAMESFEKQD